jgi:hypothetical protein
MAQSLDQAVQEWWAATTRLMELIPPERVSTEIIQANDEFETDDDQDYVFDDCVTLNITTDRLWRTNSGQGYQSSVQINVMAGDYDRAKAVIAVVRDEWDNESFIGSENKITLCRLGEEDVDQDDEDGIWTVTLIASMNHTAA